jgi:hypothetical protein
VLFSMDAWPRIADGSITTTFRTWTTPQAKTGGRYRVGGMLIEATDVQRVGVASITDGDAQRAGEADRAALLRRLRQDDGEVWRIDFTYLGADDRIERRDQAELGDDELQAIVARLARFDRGAAGPWTRSTLRLIERYPGIVSTTLARHAGQERLAFKLNVRKLKELGLTESLDVGYRLSPRGEAVLRAL